MAEDTTPNCGLPKDVFGSANCTRLNRLKNSVRNSSLKRSLICVFLTTVKSKLLIPAARNTGSVHDSLPNVKEAGWAKAAVLNHRLSRLWAVPETVTSELMTLGRD